MVNLHNGVQILAIGHTIDQHTYRVTGLHPTKALYILADIGVTFVGLGTNIDKTPFQPTPLNTFPSG